MSLSSQVSWVTLLCLIVSCAHWAAQPRELKRNCKILSGDRLDRVPPDFGTHFQKQVGWGTWLVIAQLKVQLPPTATTDPVAAAADAYFLTFYATSFSSQFKVHLADKGGAKVILWFAMVEKEWLKEGSNISIWIICTLFEPTPIILWCNTESLIPILSATFCERGDGRQQLKSI